MTEMENRNELETTIISQAKRIYREPITIGVVGRVGAGKSSTVNSLLGMQVAAVSHTTAEGTTDVGEYQGEINGIRFRVFDTPGFGGTRVSSETILTELATQLGGKVQILLYVVPLNLPRLDRIDQSSIRHLQSVFSETLWTRIVIVFTHADKYGQSFGERAEVWTKSLREEIARIAGSKVAEKVGFVAISNGHEVNPDGKEWMGELFVLVAERIAEPIPFIISQIHRMRRRRANGRDRRPGNSDSSESARESGWAPPITFTPDQAGRFRKVMSVAGCTSIGAAMGSPFGPAGALLGALGGFVVGLFVQEHV